MISDFIFDGKALSDYGYILIFTEESERIPVSVMTFDTIKSIRSDELHRVGYNYESPYTATFMILKNECVHDDLFLSTDDISELTKWLCRKQYKWFRFVDEDDNDEIWYKVYFQVNKEFAGDKCIGLTLTLTASTPYGYTREFENHYGTEVASTGGSFTVNINSDEEGYIYPDAIVTIGNIPQRGTLRLSNKAESRATLLSNCVSGEVITFIGGDTQQISSTNTHDFIREFNYQFPRFINTYDSHTNDFNIYVSGGTYPDEWITYSCTVTFKYRGIRKVGLD